MCVPYPEYGCMDYGAAVRSAMSYLEEHMPPFDQRVTLFGVDGGVDGLDVGIASVGVNMSMNAKKKYPWARNFSREIYEEYVASYAFVNEPRTDWRQLIGSVAEGAAEGAENASDATSRVNGEIWKRLNVSFRSGNTPLIYDPLSTIAFGYASCTGISATLVAALRSIGLPSRVVGTPAWKGDPRNGNHNWVEVYDSSLDEWYFLEGASNAPNSGGGGDPCSHWFCSSSRFDGSTQVFAARFDTVKNDSSFIMAWDPSNLDVPADNRTTYYNDVCKHC